MAGQSLRVAIRLAAADRLAEDLKAAMEHRTAIDLATGMIMTQSQCTQDEAVEMLKQASSNRNIKLRDLAESIINARSSANNAKTVTHFED